MNCPFCGYFCEDGVRFCPSCGGQVIADESEFLSVPSLSEAMQPEAVPMAEMLSPAEMYQQQMDEKTVRRYTGWLVFSLFLALLMVAGAIYLVAFMPKNEPEPEEAPPAEVIIPENVGSWMNDDGFIILTASGKFAADQLSGTYTMDDSTIVLDGGKEVIAASYVIEDNVLTLTTSHMGEESSFTYYFVTQRTDLSYSQLTEMWQSMGN